MNCIEFETAIERAVELREALAVAAVEHATTCSTCRQNWEIQQQLDAAIAAWRLANPSSRLVASVLDELSRSREVDDADFQGVFTDAEDSESVVSTSVDAIPVVVGRRPRRATRSGRFALATLVACVFVVIGSMTYFSGTKTEQQLDDMVDAARNRRVEMAAIDIPRNVSNTITDVLTELRSEYDDIASDTTSVARHVVNAIPSRVATSVKSVADAGPGKITRVWRPIGNQVKVAMGFLWQAVPSEGHSD